MDRIVYPALPTAPPQDSEGILRYSKAVDRQEPWVMGHGLNLLPESKIRSESRFSGFPNAPNSIDFKPSLIWLHILRLVPLLRGPLFEESHIVWDSHHVLTPPVTFAPNHPLGNTPGESCCTPRGWKRWEKETKHRTSNIEYRRPPQYCGSRNHFEFEEPTSDPSPSHRYRVEVLARSRNSSANSY